MWASTRLGSIHPETRTRERSCFREETRANAPLSARQEQQRLEPSITRKKRQSIKRRNSNSDKLLLCPQPLFSSTVLLSSIFSAVNCTTLNWSLNRLDRAQKCRCQMTTATDAKYAAACGAGLSEGGGGARRGCCPLVL